MPLPMTMQLPSNTTMISPFLRNTCFSSSLQIVCPRGVSGGCSKLWVKSSESAFCRLRIKLSLACRHSNEYSANVPPSPLSSALRMMMAYLMTGTKVRVQKMRDSTPEISPSVMCERRSPENVLRKTYSGDTHKSPYTTPKL